jgi:hypothetical protein
MPNQRIIPDTFIKNVALQIKQGYDMSNNPFPEPDERDPQAQSGFLGRVQLREKFFKFLKSRKKKGVFLVTGYRGMGKTSFVNLVIRQYADDRQQQRGLNPLWKDTEHAKDIVPIHLTLAQNAPKEIDILRLMVTSIYDRFKKPDKSSSQKTLERLQLWIIFYVVLTVLLVSYMLGSTFFENLFEKGFSVKHLIALLIAFAITGFFGRFVYIKKKVVEEEKSEDSAFNRLKKLVERCYATISEESSLNDEISFQGINARILGNSERRVKQYQVASTKEIEYELQRFLKIANNQEYIFIFDELDKVEPAIGSNYFYDDPDNKETASSYERQIRNRKQAIISIIAGLKNFLTTANARFIFIAGREMFDASLADVADRQASISSIFTYIFNIESFLKEKHTHSGDSYRNNASLSYATEEFLKAVLFTVPNTENLFRNAFAQFNAFTYEKIGQAPLIQTAIQSDSPEYIKLYFILQNFVTYLTYRSNGSPKKLIREIQEIIVIKEDIYQFDRRTIVFEQTGIKSDLYLYFNFENQYRMGFINYLYRPFLIKHGRSYKLFSDNIIQSTPYLFDHILKYHPFAFSLSNLELIPELLSTNKTPALRDHINHVISHLSLNHLREIEIGLFNYKFFSRTLNEISYLSKIFEQEGAGLNFTLDESYLVKIHVRDKIKELRNNNKVDSDKNIYQQVYSINHLNSILGDLHFFDQEYNDAILAYQDAIKPIDIVPVTEIDISDFVALCRDKLKLALCYEKMDALDQASGIYSECTRKTVKFVYSFKTSLEGVSPTESNLKQFNFTILQDLMQIVVQAFLAKMIIKEKMRFSGVKDLMLNIANFLKMVQSVSIGPPRPSLINANLLLHSGNLAYYKNTLGPLERPLKDRDATNWFNHAWVDLDAAQNTFYLKDSPKRKPTLALYLYIIGISQFLDAKRLDIKNAGASSGSALPERNLLKYLSLQRRMVPALITLILENQTQENKLLRGLDHRYIAYFLSSIGDCLLSMLEPENGYCQFTAQSVLSDSITIGDPKQPAQNFYDNLRDSPDAFGLKDILMCYYLSAEFFFKHGRGISGSFQLRKILHVFRLSLKPSTIAGPTDERLDGLIHDLVVTRLLKTSAGNAAHTEVHMMSKAQKQHKGPYNKPVPTERTVTTVALNNISNYPDTKEANILFQHIKLKLNIQLPDYKLFISSNNSVSTQFCRLMELDFHAELSYKKLSNLTNGGEDIANLIVNYLYSMLSALRILDIYNNDYSIGYRFRGITHYHLASFITNVLPLHVATSISEDEVRSQIDYLLGEGSYSSLEANYHYKMAKDFFEKAIRLHSSGTEYKTMLSDMMYLEDDFNDNSYHFGAAMDRYLINNDVFKSKIDSCISKSAKYEVQSYF